MHLRVAIGDWERGKECGGKRGSARASRVKIDLPTEPPRCWNSISLVYLALRTPVVNVKRIKYFLAAGGPENSNVTTAPRVSADFVRELKLIERLSGRNDCTLAHAFTLVTMYRARYIPRDYRYDRSNRYPNLYIERISNDCWKSRFFPGPRWTFELAAARCGLTWV